MSGSKNDNYIPARPATENNLIPAGAGAGTSAGAGPENNLIPAGAGASAGAGRSYAAVLFCCLTSMDKLSPEAKSLVLEAARKFTDLSL